MKFGGTSMGSAERIQVAAGLVTEQQAKRPVAIVVSAMSKVTDLLLDSLRKAETGDAAGLEENLAALTEKHETCCLKLLPAAAARIRARRRSRADLRILADREKGFCS